MTTTIYTETREQREATHQHALDIIAARRERTADDNRAAQIASRKR